MTTDSVDIRNIEYDNLSGDEIEFLIDTLEKSIRVYDDFSWCKDKYAKIRGKKEEESKYKYYYGDLAYPGFIPRRPGMFGPLEYAVCATGAINVALCRKMSMDRMSDTTFQKGQHICVNFLSVFFNDYLKNDERWGEYIEDLKSRTPSLIGGSNNISVPDWNDALKHRAWGEHGKKRVVEMFQAAIDHLKERKDGSVDLSVPK